MTVKLKPSWHSEPCAACGIEGTSTRAEPVPVTDVYLCEVCEMYARGAADRQAEIDALKAQLAGAGVTTKIYTVTTPCAECGLLTTSTRTEPMPVTYLCEGCGIIARRKADHQAEIDAQEDQSVGTNRKSAFGAISEVSITSQSGRFEAIRKPPVRVFGFVDCVTPVYSMADAQRKLGDTLDLQTERMVAGFFMQQLATCVEIVPIMGPIPAYPPPGPKG